MTFPEQYKQLALCSPRHTWSMLRSNPTTIRGKNNKSVPFRQFHGNKKLRSIKMHRKALALFMILSSSPFINIIQLQLSCQGRCSRPAPGCSSHPLQNFHCPVADYFHYARMLFQLQAKFKQVWVTLKSRRRQSNNSRRRQHVRFRHQDLWCKRMWNDGCWCGTRGKQERGSVRCVGGEEQPRMTPRPVGGKHLVRRTVKSSGLYSSRLSPLSHSDSSAALHIFSQSSAKLDR